MVRYDTSCIHAKELTGSPAETKGKSVGKNNVC